MVLLLILRTFIINSLWLPNMEDALPRQGPDHEDKEYEGSCVCRQSLNVPVHCGYTSPASTPSRLGLWVKCRPMSAPTGLVCNIPNPDTNILRSPATTTSRAIVCWWGAAASHLGALGITLMHFSKQDQRSATLEADHRPHFQPDTYLSMSVGKTLTPREGWRPLS